MGIFAISSQTVRNVLRISQCEKPQRISQCEISQCENHIANFAMRKTTLRISQCEKPQRISQCENHIANFGMRKTTLRISKCEKPQRISQCEISQCENHIANFAMRKENFAMPNGCLIANCLRKFMFCFFFFSSDFQYMLQNLHKTSKIKAIKIA